MPRIARTVEDVMLGEAVHGTKEERFADMLAIASVIANRAIMTKSTPQDVVSVKTEFNAYGRALPPGVERYRDLAEQAWDDVEVNGPIHNATFYATPSTSHKISRGKVMEIETTGHQFFSDPNFGAFRTAKGWKKPDPRLMPEVAEMETNYAPIPEQNPALAAIDALTSTPVDQAAQAVAADQATQDGLNALGVTERTDYQSPLGVLGDRVTSDFGPRSAPRTAMGFGSSFHPGLDMAVQAGQSGYPAQAMGAGTISDISSSPGGYGNRVEVTHPDGFVSSYSHLADIADNISIGDEIAAGTPVGTVGSTGRSTGAHLHFEVRDPNGVAIDPSSLFSANPDPSVPTPMAAERMDPNDTLAQSFDMGRFGEQPASFDMGRFADPAPSFDMARMSPPASSGVQGMDALASALAETNAGAGLTSTQMADMQERANAARAALDSQMAQSVTAMAAADPAAISGAAGQTQPSMSDLAAQYDMYGAGKITPEQNLAADVMDQSLSKKTGRVVPDYAVAEAVADPSLSTFAETVGSSVFSDPNVAAGLVGSTTPGRQVTSQAKQSVQAKAAEDKTKADQNTDRLGRSLTNSKTLGTALGATLGAVLGGPVGAAALGALGGKIGNLKPAERPRETPLQALFNIMTGKPQSLFPTPPRGGQLTGKGVGYGDLNQFGRQQYNESGQFNDAIDKGGVGLY